MFSRVISALTMTAVAMSSAGAQRRMVADRPAQDPSDVTTVRAELASVLLQSKKYNEAAREYRALVARDTTNPEFRLGLARALAWGGLSREAERELSALAKKRQSATVDSMLRAVRDAMEPRQWEAAAWVAERRDYAPYRVSYARALMRERYFWIAIAQYDTLLMGGSIGKIPDTRVLRREQANAYLEAGDREGGAARLGDLLRLTPTDTGVRHELAALLSATKRNSAARAHYDTLIATAPSATLFTERGIVRLAMHDSSGAQADFTATIPFGGTAAAYLTLGDLYRQRGDLGPARAMYRAALNKLPDLGDRMAARSLISQITREERPVAAFLPMIGDDPGWRMSTEGVGDNLGVHYAASTVRRTLGIGEVTRVGAAVVHQYLGERSPLRSIDLNAVGVEGSASSGVGYGPVFLQAGVTGGQLKLPDGPTIRTGAGAAALWVGGWGFSARTSTSPAYSSLLTTTALRPDSGRGAPITEQSLTGVLGGPLFSADIALAAQKSRFNDGNRRTTVQGYLRVPVGPGVWAVYSGTRQSFTRRSARYWDPLDYRSHGAGLEFGDRDRRGLTWEFHVLPGMAWSTTAPSPEVRATRGRPAPLVHKEAFQLSTGGEVGWRNPRWETMAAATYGQGRFGEYRRVGLTLGVRVAP